MKRDFVEILVRDMLEPVLDRQEQIVEDIEDLHRRLAQMIRLGTVLSVHENENLIKVQHGKLKTPYIKWFAESAGRVTRYRCPSVGEQVLLVNYGAGYSSVQSIALVGMESDNFSLPSADPNKVVTQYGDKCAEIWDMEAGTLTFQASEQITLATKKVHATKDIKADGDVTDSKRSMQEDRIIYNDHGHKDVKAGTDTSGKTEQKQ